MILKCLNPLTLTQKILIRFSLSMNWNKVVFHIPLYHPSLYYTIYEKYKKHRILRLHRRESKFYLSLKDGSHFCDWPESLALQSAIVKHLSKWIRIIAQNFARRLLRKILPRPIFVSRQKSLRKSSPIPINWRFSSQGKLW